MRFNIRHDLILYLRLFLKYLTYLKKQETEFSGIIIHGKLK